MFEARVWSTKFGMERRIRSMLTVLAVNVLNKLSDLFRAELVCSSEVG